MKKKICFIASSGGHLEQILMMKEIMNKYNSYLITEKTNYKIFSDSLKTYHVPQVNRRELLTIFYLLYNLVKSVQIYLVERPDVIISTGALATIPTCLVGKLFRSKIIFIESYAKVNSPTLTGRLLYKFSDQFYVQWEDMLKIYPNAIYKGGVY